MSEVPVLRLGLAGFSEAQQKAATAVVRAAGSARASWVLSPLSEADVWWLEGSRTLLMPTGMLRVQPGVPSARSVQIALADVDRPVAFTLPLAAAGFDPAITFDLLEPAQSLGVLNRFCAYLQPMLAQFCLGAAISERQPDLAAGAWEVRRGTELVALVDVRQGAAVAATSTSSDFLGATWTVRSCDDVAVPAGFARVSVSQLMWQYALRTERDLLPPHYRHKPLFFRRPPRLAQRQLKDAHLLLLRELAAQPGMGFEQLQQATGLGDVPLARHLAALYVVGSITANPRRSTAASPGQRTMPDSAPPGPSAFASELDLSSMLPQAAQRPPSDLTAPAPLMRDATVPAPLLPDRER
jgi:hypothetical protein